MISDRYLSLPLLFTKRRRAVPAIVSEYVGTDTELDPKDAGQRLVETQDADSQSSQLSNDSRT
jgi:hypothetical protein